MKYKFPTALLSITLGALPLLAELKYFPKDKDELLQLVKNEGIKLDTIDTSKITDMSYLFCQVDWYGYEECKFSAKKRKDFSGIEKWDTSNVENMAGMFLKNMDFNQPIGKWNVSKVKDMHSMFQNTKIFNQPLNSWNVGNVENMEEMFYVAEAFNQPLNSWNVSKVENMTRMFAQSEHFNQPLDSWDVSNVKNMEEMFYSASVFNQSLNSWNVSKVENMSGMFYGAKAFNQPLNSWNVSNVKNMKQMFYRANTFNQPLNSWKLNKQVNTDGMFKYGLTSFDQNLDSWGEKNPFKKVTPNNKNELLSLLYKDYPLKLIDVSKIKDMSYLFCQADSNICETSNKKRIDFEGIETWDVSNVENMEGMFLRNEYFNEPLNQWNIAKVKNLKKMFFQAKNFNQSLSSWNIRKDADTQAMLLGTKWFAQNIIPNLSTKITPHNKEELIELVKYQNLPLSSIDTSQIKDMSYLFCQSDLYRCKDSIKDRKDYSGIETWDISNVENMEGMFYENEHFNQPIGSWNVSKVKNMNRILTRAKAFNQDLSSWGDKIQEAKERNLEAKPNPKEISANLKKFSVFMGVDKLGAIELFSQYLRQISKGDVSKFKDMYEFFANTKLFDQNSNKNPLKPQEANQCRFEEAFNLIGVDEPRAIELFSQCLQQKEESKIYLAYLYLNQKQPDIAKGSALAVEYANHLYNSYCSNDNNHNFCQDYGTPPQEISKVEQVFDILYFGGLDFSFGMIPSHPDVLRYTEGYYGSSRDASLGGFVGEYPKPFKSITISKIFSAKNSYKLAEFLEPLNYDEGTMRFYTSRNSANFGISLDFCPQRVFEYSLDEEVTKDLSPTEDPDKWFFGWFYVTIKENPDLLQAYNECVQETQEYYQNVLKLPAPKAKIYAEKAVQSLLLNELL